MLLPVEELRGWLVETSCQEDTSNDGDDEARETPNDANEQR